MRRSKEKKTGPVVRTIGGKHYISTEDFQTFPTIVRESILPKYKQLFVTRFNTVVGVYRVPTAEEQTVETYF